MAAVRLNGHAHCISIHIQGAPPCHANLSLSNGIHTPSSKLCWHGWAVFACSGWGVVTGYHFLQPESSEENDAAAIEIAALSEVAVPVLPEVTDLQTAVFYEGTRYNDQEPIELPSGSVFFSDHG